jgi:hypothetical protein
VKTSNRSFGYRFGRVVGGGGLSTDRLIVCLPWTVTEASDADDA